MDYSKIKEVMDVDAGDRSVDEVNRRLAEGWVILNIRVGRSKRGPEEFTDFALYTLGRPSE